MAWIYEIVSGKLYSPLGELCGAGYSGAAEHRNEATAQSLRNLGPICEGTYTIGPPIDTVTHGPFVLPLTPDSKNLMWGRYGFLIHGDSVVAPGTASQGCIIMPPDVRRAIWTDSDHTLQVIAQKGEL